MNCFFDLLNSDSECFLLENQIMSANSKEIQLSDDILIDIFNFFGRKDHQYLNLVDQRFNILSEFVANRLTPREISSLLEVIGIKSAGQFVGNTIIINPPWNSNNLNARMPCSEIPQVAPPSNLLHITELEIKEFIGNELLQFLNVSRRLFVGCWLRFMDFDSFTRLHSMQFIQTFFGFFNRNESIQLWHVSKETAHLFRNPELFCCTNLCIECTGNFDLNILLNWLYFNGNNDGKKRILGIGFNGVHEGLQVEKALQFMESIAEDFMRSNSARNQFTIEIEIRDGPHIPNVPNLSMENPRTGETLTVLREYNVYSIVRAKKIENDEQVEEEEEGMEPKSIIYIGDIIKGDIGE